MGFDWNHLLGLSAREAEEIVTIEEWNDLIDEWNALVDENGSLRECVEAQDCVFERLSDLTGDLLDFADELEARNALLLAWNVALVGALVVTGMFWLQITVK